MITTDVEDVEAQAAPPNRRRRIALIVAAAVLFVVLLVWLVVFSPVFGVRTVTVHGTHRLTAAQVERAADIAHGTPLVRLDTAAITQRVERLPEVESAEVSTSFPSTVVITVVERAPVGYVRSGGHAVLVDRTGDQYRTVASPPAGLPRFVVPAGTDARTTGGAVAVVARALPAKLLRRITSIQAMDPTAISLVFRDGHIVQWGSAASSAAKARVLPALLRQPGDQINVTNPDQPYIHS